MKQVFEITRKLLRSETIVMIILSILALTLFISTAANGYSWLNYGVDGGDLLSAALTNGVAHPSGYPLYTSVLRGIGNLFPNQPARAANLLNSLFTTAMAVAFFRFLSIRFKRANLDVGYAAFAAFAISAMLLTAPLIWSHATITEVYALHLLLITILFFLTEMDDTKQWRLVRDIGIGLVFGLGLANHLTMIFAIPFLMPTGEIRQADLKNLRGRLLLRIGVAAILAGCFYVGLLFTNQTSPIRWNDPQNIQDLMRLVSGSIYHSYFSGSDNFIWQRVLALPGWLVEQVGAFGTFLGLWGLVYIKRRSYRECSIAFFGVAYILFSLVYPTYDSYVYLMPFLLVFCLWAADGAVYFGNAAKGSKIGLVLVTILLLNVGFGVWQNWGKLNISGDTSAEDFGRSILISAPMDAVILAERDKELFALWYLNDGLGLRPDVTVVAANLANMDWYQRVMTRVMPSVQLPSEFTGNGWRSENTNKVICEITSVDLATLDCGIMP